MFRFFSRLPHANRAVLGSNPPRGDVSPLHPTPKAARFSLSPIPHGNLLKPGTGTPEHPRQDRDHGADRRILTPAQKQDRTGQTARPRHNPARPGTQAQLKKKFPAGPASPPRNQSTGPDPIPSPDRSPCRRGTPGAATLLSGRIAALHFSGERPGSGFPDAGSGSPGPRFR